MMTPKSLHIEDSTYQIYAAKVSEYIQTPDAWAKKNLVPDVNRIESIVELINDRHAMQSLEDIVKDGRPLMISRRWSDMAFDADLNRDCLCLFEELESLAKNDLFGEQKALNDADFLKTVDENKSDPGNMAKKIFAPRFEFIENPAILYPLNQTYEKLPQNEKAKYVFLSEPELFDLYKNGYIDNIPDERPTKPKPEPTFEATPEPIETEAQRKLREFGEMMVAKGKWQETEDGRWVESETQQISEKTL